MNAVRKESGWDAVQIVPGDQVAVALRDLSGSVRVRRDNKVVSVTLLEPIPLGHKFALVDLGTGDEVCKYGAPIGRATQPILAGAHVHIHNLISQRARQTSGPRM
ncbi:MAG: UxaA family hydrolase [Rhizobiaceae bacterium]